MKNIKKGVVFMWICKSITAGMVAMLLLSIFVWFYKYTGTHIDNKTGATDYTEESRQWKAEMEEGLVWLRCDENGFNNIIDLSENNLDILLMGSSHMSAYQMAPNKNVGALLNELLPSYSTYNIGMSGHTLYRCADNIEAALDEYNPKRYVIVETDRVELEEKKMLEVIEGTAQKIPSYDSGIVYQLQKIPALKELYNSINDWISMNSKNVVEESVSVNVEESDYKQTLSTFLDIISSASKNKEVQAIICYHPKQSVNVDGTLVYEEDLEKKRIFEELCEEKKIIFVDMTEGFEQLYKEEYLLAHGFWNTAVGSGHMNKYGHRAMAEELVKTIEQMEGK